MGESITFIHSGDVHLGAPFRGVRALSPAWADRLVQAIPEAYDRAIDAAIARDVDFMLLAGDVFDTDKPSYAHYRRFLEGLRRLDAAGIPAYMIAGNHDPYPNWRDVVESLPENARLFGSDEPTYFLHERSGRASAVIAARGFSNHPQEGNIAAGMTRSAALASVAEHAGSVPAAPFVVGMLHTGLWMDPYKAPADEGALLAAGMDYWALGHIHKRYQTPDSDPKLAYCGCIQGRDIKETGDRGCFCVTLSAGEPNALEFIPTESVEWERLSVDVSRAAGVEDVLQACVRAMFDANAAASCDEMIARVTLCGSTPLHATLSQPGFVEDLRADLNDRYPSFYCDALIDETQAPVDRLALEREGLFPATFLRIVRERVQGGPSAQAAQEAFGRKNGRSAAPLAAAAAVGERAAGEGSRAAVDGGDVDIAPLDVPAFVRDEFSARGLVMPEGARIDARKTTERAVDIVLDLLGKRGS